MTFKHKQIYTIGDIHGEFYSLLNIINNLPDDSLIIQVGDFGVGFNIPYEKSVICTDVSPLLQKKNCTLIAIRGNHDNPELFNGLYAPNVYLIPDYTILKCCDIVMLCVGGGVSIDRKYRKPYKTYWYNETAAWKPELMPLSTDVDVLFTHAANTSANPYGSDLNGIASFIERDPALIRDIDEERTVHENLVNWCKPSKWYFGHYHQSSEKTINCGSTTVIATCLDIDECKLVEV